MVKQRDIWENMCEWDYRVEEERIMQNAGELVDLPLQVQKSEILPLQNSNNEVQSIYSRKQLQNGKLKIALADHERKAPKVLGYC